MRDKKKILKEIRSWVLIILAAFLASTLITSKVVAKVQVEQKSMENTLFENQQLLVDKFSYNFVKPKRGDIIIFVENGNKGTILDDALRNVKNIISIFSGNGTSKDSGLVKRVIGIAGDEIDLKDGYVYLNGEKLEETYVNGKTLPRELKFPIKVGENKLFVLGDNRMVSMDSREFGVIDLKQVEGRAFFRVYPMNQIGKLK